MIVANKAVKEHSGIVAIERTISDLDSDMVMRVPCNDEKYGVVDSTFMLLDPMNSMDNVVDDINHNPAYSFESVRQANDLCNDIERIIKKYKPIILVQDILKKYPELGDKIAQLAKERNLGSPDAPSAPGVPSAHDTSDDHSFYGE